MLKRHSLNLGYVLLFMGNVLLLTQQNFPIYFSVLFIVLGHILVINFGKNKIGLIEILKIDFILGVLLMGYYLIFNDYNLGLVHNCTIALILWGSWIYLRHKNIVS